MPRLYSCGIVVWLLNAWEGLIVPIRIVIADDHAMFRSGIKAVLEGDSDLEVVAEAGDGSETLKIVDETDFDVLILDIGLPDLAGPRVAEKVLSKNPELPIVILTMHDDEHYLQELLRIGVRGYILKKSTESVLRLAVRAVHRGDRYVDPSLTDLIISPYIGKPSRKSRDPEGGLSLLTPREQGVCQLLAQGYSHAKVAEALGISPRTVETHRANLMRKLELENRAELFRFAFDSGLMELNKGADAGNG